MIIQYFRTDGTCKIERANINARYIEMPDGMHPVTNDSIWQDDKRRRQPIMCIFEGVTPPLGADMTPEDIESILTEIELIKLGFKKASVSKMWARALVRAFEWLYARGLPLAIFGFAAYMVITSFMGG